MTALLIFGFSGWEFVGILLWVAILAALAWWGLDRKESIAEKDRQWARRHRL